MWSKQMASSNGTLHVSDGPAPSSVRRESLHKHQARLCADHLLLKFYVRQSKRETRTTTKEHRCDTLLMGLSKDRREPRSHISQTAPSSVRLGDENMHIFQRVLCVNRWPLPTVCVINWEIKVSWPLRSLVKKGRRSWIFWNKSPLFCQDSVLLLLECLSTKRYWVARTWFWLGGMTQLFPLKKRGLVRALLTSWSGISEDSVFPRMTPVKYVQHRAVLARL